eukprot:TCONS_00059429-protein
MKEITQRQPVYNGYTIVLSGSTKEGVRVGNPYEVDYMIVYDELQFETIKECRSNPGFLEVELKGNSLIRFEKFTIERQLNAGKLMFNFLRTAHEIVIRECYREREQHLRINGVKYVKDYQFFKKRTLPKLAESAETLPSDNSFYGDEDETKNISRRKGSLLNRPNHYIESTTEYAPMNYKVKQNSSLIKGSGARRGRQPFTLHGPMGEAGTDIPYSVNEHGYNPVVLFNKRQSKWEEPTYMEVSLHGGNGEQYEEFPLDVADYHVHSIPPNYHEQKVPNATGIHSTNIQNNLDKTPPNYHEQKVPNATGIHSTNIQNNLDKTPPNYHELKVPNAAGIHSTNIQNNLDKTVPTRKGLKPALLFSVRGLIKNREIGDIDMVLAFKLNGFWPECANHWKTVQLNISDTFRNKILEEGVLIVPKAPNQQKSSLRHFKIFILLS